MKGQAWHIAIFGTFDVENYGDLLFPLIAEAELTRRLGPIQLHRFSYHAKTPPHWPYAVTSLTALPEIAPCLDGVLIGGGFLIRFDKEVASGYVPPIAEIHHPTGYWLTPALIALQHDSALIWNAPGMHCNDIPEWAEPLLTLALENSRHIRVRDEPSKQALARFASEAQIEVLPDTAWGISRLIDTAHPSAEWQDLRERLGLAQPYIVLQAAKCGLDYFVRMVNQHPQRFAGWRFLVLPIGPVLGDQESNIDAALPGTVRLPFWPHPLLLAEILAHADGVVGHSYHLTITAQAFGVPVFSSADLNAGKYTALSEFETIFALPGEFQMDPDWFLARFGKGRPSPAAYQALDQLSAHWDRIATVLQEQAPSTQPALNRFWQDLPNVLEATARQQSPSDLAYSQIRKGNTHLEAARIRLELTHTQLERTCAQLEAKGEQMDIEQSTTHRQINALTSLLARAEAQWNEARQLDQDRLAALEKQLVLMQSTAQNRHEQDQQRIAELSQLLRDTLHAQERLHTENQIRQERIEALNRALASNQTTLAKLYNSRSMKFTAPLRFTVRSLQRLIGK